jgi:hypothetical protein
VTPLSALWLPIVLSAVIVFVASSIMHMLLPYHHGDYKQLPDEDKTLSALRTAGLKRGLYVFPHATHQTMKTPAVIEKYNQGPVGMMTVFPSGPPFLLSRAHRPAAHGLLGCVPHRGHRRIPLLRPRSVGERDLEGISLELRSERSSRRSNLRPTDGRNLRLALAKIELV